MRLSEPTFALEIPEGWSIKRDEERIYLVSESPVGVLCCTPETVTDGSELPNLSRMLAGFLTRTGHAVATDELLRISNVPGAAGFCWQYFEDGTFHRVWIFGNHTSWMFWSFTSAVADLDHFHPLLEGLLKSLSLVEHDGAR